MEIKAIANNVKVSPQKVRLVVDQIRKMKPEEAIAMLPFVNKRAAAPVKKVIGSAIANAKHNFGINPETLAIKSIQVGVGPMLKRFRPVSRGRAHSIQKKTSHIKVILETQESKKEQKKEIETKEKQK